MEAFTAGRYEAGTSNIKFKNQDVKFDEASTSSSWQNGNFASSNIESGNITCKAGEIPYYHADYYTAVEMSKKMYNTEYVQSMLITGTMWDVTLNYILTDTTEENPIDLKNSPWGNYNTETISYEAGRGRYLTVNSSSGMIIQKATVSDGTYQYGIRTSASSEEAKKKNIYDLAGNLWEWTEEQSYVSAGITNLYRGGSFQDSLTFNARPVCYRAYDVVNSTNTNVGFRAVLYIK